MTDGMLLHEFLTDPKLEAFDVLVIDEAHERSLETDIILGLVKQQRRPSLKVIIMSATMNHEKFSAFFNCPVVEVAGRNFEVDVIHRRGASISSLRAHCLDKSVEAALMIHKTEPQGDILVFLSGQREIEDACRIFRDFDAQLDYDRDVSDTRIHGIIIIPIYAALETLHQRAAFEATPAGYRKIVFATNIAATSVTIDGIVYVVDCGYVKQKMYDPVLSMDSLLLVPISQSAANQRAGRCGRTQRGKVFRLYSSEAYEKLAVDTVPEIQRTSLTSTILALKRLGIQNVVDFPFIDPPDVKLVITAARLLFHLNAIDEIGILTPRGRLISQIPLSPQLACAAIVGCEMGCGGAVVRIAAMVSSEKTLMTKHGVKVPEKLKHTSGDHMTLLAIFTHFASNPTKQWCDRNQLNFRFLVNAKNVVRQVEKQLQRLKLNSHFSELEIDSTLVLKAFLSAFYFNLAKKHASTNTFYHSSHQTATTNTSTIMGMILAPESSLDSNDFRLEWIMYNDVQRSARAIMRVASKVAIEWIDEIGVGGRTLKSFDYASLVGVAKEPPAKIICDKPSMQIIAPGNTPQLHVVQAIQPEKDRIERVDEARERYLARKRTKM